MVIAVNVRGLIKDVNFNSGSIINSKQGMKKKIPHLDPSQGRRIARRRLVEKLEGTDEINHT